MYFMYLMYFMYFMNIWWWLEILGAGVMEGKNTERREKRIELLYFIYFAHARYVTQSCGCSVGCDRPVSMETFHRSCSWQADLHWAGVQWNLYLPGLFRGDKIARLMEGTSSEGYDCTDSDTEHLFEAPVGLVFEVLCQWFLEVYALKH